ncbi:hypothetical protein CPB84DRAFT_1746014 [Gymnopilus junonius]|uniref:Uncharacterized protein n=1 Tax=Gymnopilus junonius TaxID=109634 RepID=A0A9P5NTF9_GYMJU|nr:hypothetical protein CPB84DRAFT_1746014 [Gymnopilus junonius]
MKLCAFDNRKERTCKMEPEVASYGLCFCPADLNMANYMNGDRIIALDFGATCFLLPSFFTFVLHKEDTDLTQLIVKKVKYATSTEVDAMLTTSLALVPFRTRRCSARAQVQEQVKPAAHKSTPVC